MKKKNNYPLPDVLENKPGNLVSSTDFTGLMPSGIESESEAISYSELYQVPTNVKDR
ncbi:MAG: hypothetical protein FWF57_02885 [Defluviitaleaceae bacterium]|nr:hypothetical protein [Defluviitaleaceae bacterium]